MALAGVPQRTYDEDEINFYLSQLALHGGNTRATVRTLERDGKNAPSRNTLQAWKRDRRDAYTRIEQDLDAHLGHKRQAMAERYLEIQHEIVDKIREELKENNIPARDLGGLARNMAVGQGIEDTGAASALGRPTTVIEHRSSKEIFKGLERLGLLTEGSAEEVHEADVVEDSPKPLAQGPQPTE